jgi:hypothetical protein
LTFANQAFYFQRIKMVRPMKSPSNEAAANPSPQSFAYGSPITYGFPPSAPGYHGTAFEQQVQRAPHPGQLPQVFNVAHPHGSGGSSYSSPPSSRMSGPSSDSSRNTPDRNEYYPHPATGAPTGPPVMPPMASPSPGGSPWRYRSSQGMRQAQFSNGK